MIAFFSVHCSKKKGGGLGLGILALAGGGGSSSSSSGDSTDKPKDDPNNDPEFDEVKQKIESTIKFPTQNENKVLKNNNDYKSVDLSITGEFFQDLKNLKDLEVEHQVSAGEKKTTATTIPITETFITNQKIPLVSDLSSLQPDTGFIQPKLSLKFSSEKRQIILKDWTQNFVLEGKKQTPLLSYIDKNNKEKPFKEPIIQDETIDSNADIPIKISSPRNIAKNLEIRMEATKLGWASSTGNHNKTFSPNLTALTPSTSDGPKLSKDDLKLKLGVSYTIASKLFYRFKGTKNWLSSEPFINYYNFLISGSGSGKVYPNIKINQLLFKRGEKMTLTFSLPSELTNNKLQGILFSAVLEKNGTQKAIYIIRKDGKEIAPDDSTRRDKLIKNIDHKPINEPLVPDKDYTVVFEWKDNLEITPSIVIDIRLEGLSGLTPQSLDFQIHLDTK